MNTTRWPPGLLPAAAATASAAALALSLPPLRWLIEQSMVWHMLVQMPLLVAAGALCAAALQHWRLRRHWRPGRPAAHPTTAGPLGRIDRYGLTGFMAALMVGAYWMIPATVDRAVVLPSADAAKIVSLWLAGAALQQAFGRAPAAVQLFFVGSALPMGVWVGVYLASTDLRLCNAYSLASQVQTGRGMVVLSLLAGAAWLASLRGAARPRGAAARSMQN